MSERELIAKMHWEGKGIGEIAGALGRDKGTISGELKRNLLSGIQMLHVLPCTRSFC
jgi:IS30 family transposase